MASNIFERLAEYKVMICIECKTAVWPGEVARHLKGQEHALSNRISQEIQQEVMTWTDMAMETGTAALPDVLEQPIRSLRLESGWQCRAQSNKCQYVCCKESTMRKHVSENHKGVRGKHGGKRARSAGQAAAQAEPDKLWTKVACQRFFGSRNGSSYIRVNAANAAVAEAENISEDGFRSGMWTELDSKLKESRKSETVIGEADPKDTRGWIGRAGWLEYFQGIDRERLVEMTQEPKQTVEPVAYKIWQTMGELAAQCQDTVGRVGLFERQEAVRVELSQTKYKPLQKYMDRRAIRDYSRPWKQMLMVIFRAHQRRDWPKLRLKFERREKKSFRKLRIVVDDELLKEDMDCCIPSEEEYSTTSEDSQLSTGSSARAAAKSVGKVTGLQKALLNFCLALLSRTGTKRGAYDSVLVCCMATLAAEEDGWKGPASYPPILSRIVKIARFMVVQQAWQMAGYGDSDSEDEDAPSCRDLIKKMTDKFMIKGTGGPIDWLLALRNYMMSIAKTCTSTGYIT